MENIGLPLLCLIQASLMLCLGLFFGGKSGKSRDKKDAPEDATEKTEVKNGKEDKEPAEGLFARLRAGLTKTQGHLTKRLDLTLSSGKKIDPSVFEELEEILITSDVGVKTTASIIAGLRKRVDKNKIKDVEALREALREELASILERVESPLEIPDLDRPYVLMVTGVNGTGKTTTIGKLAMRLTSEGKSVLLAASDTFRAAAIEQLEIWGERASAPVVKHREGADPSAVAFDALKAAVKKNADVVIVDTAGRLHTRSNLMEELKKVKRIIARELPGAPDEVMLVLDATTGQNAVQQAKIFKEAVEVTGITLTKLDGTAKGGIVIAVSDELNIPLRFIGVGEKINDLQEFNARDFVAALFESG